MDQENRPHDSSPEILKNIITEKTKKPTTLLQMGEWERERLRIRANELNKVNTYRQSRSLQAHLQEYLHSLGKKDIPLTEIDEAFGQGYKVHLVKGKNLGPAQANHCLIWLNRLLWLGVYNTTDDEKPVFPLPTLNSAWTDIHEIGFAIGRTENLSAHMARHTFGTMLVSEGICLESIAKMMGHSSVKSTQVYASAPVMVA